MLVGLNQPLLNGFGFNANSKFIRISKNNSRIADSVFRQQVIVAITQVLNLYYDMVYFRDNVRVAERSLALAEKTLSDNKRQVEIGTLAPIEVVRAESEVAARPAGSDRCPNQPAKAADTPHDGALQAV